MIQLTAEERRRFAAYCREQAQADASLAEQMAKIKTPKPVIERYQAEAAALLVVARRLDKTTEDTL